MFSKWPSIERQKNCRKFVENCGKLWRLLPFKRFAFVYGHFDFQSSTLEQICQIYWSMEQVSLLIPVKDDNTWTYTAWTRQNRSLTAA